MMPLSQASSPFSFRISELQSMRATSLQVNRVQIDIELILEFIYLNYNSFI